MRKINRKKFTVHGYNRVVERSDINEKELQTLSMYAIRNGLNDKDIPRGALKSYFRRKKRIGNKKIKIYRGYVFIFFVNSNRLITCYPLPEKYREEYERIMKRLKDSEVKKDVKNNTNARSNK